MKDDTRGTSETPKSRAGDRPGQLSLPTGELTISSALEHFGRDLFDELLAEFDWDAELTNDGDTVVTFTDPRNQEGISDVTQEFLTWLKDEATMPSNANDVEPDEK